MREARGTLVPPLSTLVGRVRELAEVERLVCGSRLVVLTGAGGCGKTRLAAEIAARLGDRFEGGAWWVDLASLTDEALVPSVVAAALGVREVPGQDVTETVCERLANDVRLVVFDNCEHLASPVSVLVDKLVRRCTNVSVLATSRARLGVDGELSFLVPPLEVPAPGEDVDPSRFDAVELFVRRASDAGVQVPASATVAAICREVDGMPLAIELAAARTRVMQPEQILGGLSDRFRLLFGTKTTSTPRHRTLRASVDWSYRLLSDDEQLLLRRLAVFPAEFDLARAEAICGDLPPLASERVLELLSSLVDQSLIRVDRGPERTRFRLLETIRAYASERLDEFGERAAVADRHLGVYVALAEEAARYVHGRDQLAWLDGLDRERADLRAALAWARASGQMRTYAKLIAALAYFHVYRGETSELTLRLPELFDLPPEVIDARTRAELLLVAAGGMYFMFGDVSKSAEMAESALAIGREHDDAAVVGRAGFQLGITALNIDPGQASRLFEEAGTASRDAGDHMHLGMALSDLAFARHMAGDPARAAGLIAEGLRASRASGSRWAEANGLLWRAVIRCDIGALDSARADIITSIERCRELGELLLRGFQHAVLGRILVALGDLEAARPEVAKGLALAAQIASKAGIAWGTRNLGIVELASGDIDRAAATLAHAVELNAAAEIRFVAADALAVLGMAELRRGNLDVAAVTFADAEALARDRWIVAWAQTLLGRAALAWRTGDPGRASGVAHDALELAMRAGLAPIAVEAVDLLAMVHAESGRHADALMLHSCAVQQRLATGVLWASLLDLGDAAFASARAALDDGATAPEVRGRAMTLEDAVAFVGRGRGARRRPSFGWDSLSPIERDVVALVAQGLTNREVGEKLFISPRTVQSHLRHVFTRVGVSTRGELAAEAARRGL